MGSYNGKLIEPLVLSIANSAKNIWLIITPPQKKLPNTKQTFKQEKE